MEFSSAIFDMDGTLIDSMHIWNTQGEDYLTSRGIEPEPCEHDLFLAMGATEFLHYVKGKFGFEESVEEMKRDINARVSSVYAKIKEPKPGVRAYLEKLSKKGVRMAVATATDRCHVESVLSRCGILHFFDLIVTCGEVGIPKTRPDVFDAARKAMGTSASETAVFEDSLHAAETAKAAGYKVVGVYDRFSEEKQEELRSVSDIYITSFEELLDISI